MRGQGPVLLLSAGMWCGIITIIWAALINIWWLDVVGLVSVCGAAGISLRLDR